MAIEKRYMKYGLGADGILGLTNIPELVKAWIKCIDEISECVIDLKCTSCKKDIL